MTILGTAGDDTLTGNANNNFFDVSQGGNDTVSGLEGDDVTYFGDSFTANDHVDGGSGIDTVVLEGASYAGGLTLTANSFTSVERLVTGASGTYTITAADGNLAGKAAFIVDGSALGSQSDLPGSLIFDGSQQDHGRFLLIGGNGSDTLTGGTLSDVFDLTRGEGFTKLAFGGGGGDRFVMGNQYDSNDQIDGGTGNDSVFFSGMGTQSAINFTAPAFTSIESLHFEGDRSPTNTAPHQSAPSFSFTVSEDDSAVAADATVTIDGSDLGRSTLDFDGSDESDGHFRFIGSRPVANEAPPGAAPPPDGLDTFIGGALRDTFHVRDISVDITGGGGADFIIATTASEDTFTYNDASDSTSEGMDRIRGVNFVNDTFVAPWGVVTEVTELDGGRLGRPHFDTQLATAIGDALTAHAALVFQPSEGPLQHRAFLVIDVNGVAGYQAGADIVIDVTGFTGISK